MEPGYGFLHFIAHVRIEQRAVFFLPNAILSAVSAQESANMIKVFAKDDANGIILTILIRIVCDQFEPLALRRVFGIQENGEEQCASRRTILGKVWEGLLSEKPSRHSTLFPVVFR